MFKEGKISRGHLVDVFPARSSVRAEEYLVCFPSFHVSVLVKRRDASVVVGESMCRFAESTCSSDACCVKFCLQWRNAIQRVACSAGLWRISATLSGKMRVRTECGIFSVWFVTVRVGWGEGSTHRYESTSVNKQTTSLMAASSVVAFEWEKQWEWFMMVSSTLCVNVWCLVLLAQREENLEFPDEWFWRWRYLGDLDWLMANTNQPLGELYWKTKLIILY